MAKVIDVTLDEIKLPVNGFGVFSWFDKIDGYYLTGMTQLEEHPSVIARSYLAAFQQDRKLQYKRFELHLVAVFDSKSGKMVQIAEDSVYRINPLEVWSEKPFNPDEAIKEM